MAPVEIRRAINWCLGAKFQQRETHDCANVIGPNPHHHHFDRAPDCRPLQQAACNECPPRIFGLFAQAYGAVPPIVRITSLSRSLSDDLRPDGRT